MTDLPPAGDRPDPDFDAPAWPAPEAPVPEAPMPEAPNMADIPASPLAPPVETPAPAFSASPLAEAPVAAAAMPDAPAAMPDASAPARAAMADAPVPEAPIPAAPPPPETAAAPVAEAPAAAVPAAAAAAAWESPPAAPPGTPEVPGAPGRYFAATITRVAAYLVDSLLVAFLAGLLGAVVAILMPDTFGTTDFSFEEPAPAASATGMLGLAVLSVGGLVFSYLYFFLSWRSTGKATPGQRVFKMQVGNAFDGAALTTRQITIRWLALFAVGILALIPALAGIGFFATIVWDIVLLVTVATSATKQGLHDRWSGSAVVATGPQNTALAWGCLIAYIVAVVALIIIALALFAAIFAVMYSAF